MRAVSPAGTLLDARMTWRLKSVSGGVPDFELLNPNPGLPPNNPDHGGMFSVPLGNTLPLASQGAYRVISALPDRALVEFLLTTTAPPPVVPPPPPPPPGTPTVPPTVPPAVPGDKPNEILELAKSYWWVPVGVVVALKVMG